MFYMLCRSNADSATSKGGRPFPLIVAGSVTSKDLFADFSQGRLGQPQLVWAPGVNVRCARGWSIGSDIGTGTSFSAGMVSHGCRRLERKSERVFASG